MHWTESQSETSTENEESRVREDIHYSNREDYFKHKIHLFGSGHRTTIEPGERGYDFSFTIPYNIPASFDGDHGEIKYTVKAKLDIPWAFDLKSKKEFIVNDFMTINDYPASMEGVSNENYTHLCCCCCQSGPIKGRCWLPKQGYFPGELIPFCAEIENLSFKTMRGSYLKLIQHIHYHATDKTRVEQTEIFHASRPGFESEDYWSDFKITVPNIPLAPFRFTDLIDINYEVQLEVDPGACSSSLYVKLPIMILSVPVNYPSTNQSSPMENPIGPIGLSVPQPTLAGAGFPVPPIPYPGGPVPPPNVGNLPYPMAMPDTGVGFIPPEQPHTGGNSYGPVPSSPVSAAAPITQPPYAPPIVQQPQGGYSYARVPESDNNQPTSSNDCSLEPASGSESVVASPTPNPLQEPSRYAINTSIPYFYTPVVSSVDEKD